MIPSRSASAVLLTAAWLVAASAHPLLAQATIEARAATVTVGGRVNVQYRSSSVDDATSEVFLRRARARLEIGVSDFLDGRLQAELAGDPELKDAWMRMNFDPAFRVSFGQFKRAFSGFFLASSTDLPIIERDGRVEGIDACSGVGGVCTFQRLTSGLSFDGRDLGVRVQGATDGGFGYQATLTNGEGENEADVNDAKSFSGRVEYDRGGIRLGLFGGLHDALVEEPSGEEDTEYSGAFGADVEVGDFRQEGVHLVASVAAGENREAGPDASFLAAQLLVTRYFSLEGRLEGVEPLLRVSVADPDDDVDDDGAVLVTPGVMLHVLGKNAVALNVDVYAPSGEADTEFSLKLQTFLYF